MNDLDRKALILDELEYDPAVDAEDIGVVVDSGVVTLYGHVKSFTQRMAAERAAQRCEGVRAIANEIVVRLPGDAPADDDIATRAAQIIAWDPFVLGDGINLRVQHGHIDLEGEVQWRFQKLRASKLLEHLDGVIGVHNHLRIKPVARTKDVKERIETALQRSFHHGARSVYIVVADEKVILTGKVKSLAERKLVENTAWKAPGVEEVVNALRVE
jgi:osmotically-inducible protein OsmY